MDFRFVKRLSSKAESQVWTIQLVPSRYLEIRLAAKSALTALIAAKPKRAKLMTAATTRVIVSSKSIVTALAILMWKIPGLSSGDSGLH